MVGSQKRGFMGVVEKKVMGRMLRLVVLGGIRSVLRLDRDIHDHCTQDMIAILDGGSRAHPGFFSL